MAILGLPRACVKCGSTMVGVEEGSRMGCFEEAGRRLVFPNGRPDQIHFDDVREEIVICVGWQPLLTVPSYVCLTCQPDWKTIQQLAVEIDKCWEQVILNPTAEDFAARPHWTTMRQQVQDKRDELLAKLLHDPYWEGTGLGALLPQAKGVGFALLYENLGKQVGSPDAEHALKRIKTALAQATDEVRALTTGDPPLLPNMLDGRLYPPFDDFVTRNADGSISARTRGHYIEIESDGSIRIINRIRITDRVCGLAEFEQPGGGK